MWIAMALILARGWTWIPAVLLALLIGLSRLYLGVHSLLDVTGGWLLGSLLVWGYWAGTKSISQWWAEQDLGAKWRVISFVCLLLLLLALGARLYLGSWTVPDNWTIEPAQTNPVPPPVSPIRVSDGLIGVGALWGLGMGGVWLAAHRSYSAEGSWQKRALRIAAGALGLLVLALVAYLLIPRLEGLPLLILQVVLATLGGVWISALAPLTFMRLGLAQRESVV
jgi:hypothetical protein